MARRKAATAVGGRLQRQATASTVRGIGKVGAGLGGMVGGLATMAGGGYMAGQGDFMAAPFVVGVGSKIVGSSASLASSGAKDIGKARNLRLRSRALDDTIMRGRGESQIDRLRRQTGAKPITPSSVQQTAPSKNNTYQSGRGIPNANNAMYWNGRARNHDVRGDGDADTMKNRPKARIDGNNVVPPVSGQRSGLDTPSLASGFMPAGNVTNRADFAGINRRTTGIMKVMGAAIPAMMGGPVGWGVAATVAASGLNDLRQGAKMQRNSERATAQPNPSMANGFVAANGVGGGTLLKGVEAMRGLGDSATGVVAGLAAAAKRLTQKTPSTSERVNKAGEKSKAMNKPHPAPEKSAPGANEKGGNNSLPGGKPMVKSYERYDPRAHRMVKVNEYRNPREGR